MPEAHDELQSPVLCPACVLCLRCCPGDRLAASGRRTRRLALDRPSRVGRLAGWKAFLEDPGVKVGDVWRLADGVLPAEARQRDTYTEKDTATSCSRSIGAAPGQAAGQGRRADSDHRSAARSGLRVSSPAQRPRRGHFWGLDGYRLQGPADRLQSIAQSAFGTLDQLEEDRRRGKAAGQWSHYEVRADETR